MLWATGVASKLTFAIVAQLTGLGGLVAYLSKIWENHYKFSEEYRQLCKVSEITSRITRQTVDRCAWLEEYHTMSIPERMVPEVRRFLADISTPSLIGFILALSALGYTIVTARRAFSPSSSSPPYSPYPPYHPPPPPPPTYYWEAPPTPTAQIMGGGGGIGEGGGQFIARLRAMRMIRDNTRVELIPEEVN